VFNIFESFISLSKRPINDGDKAALEIIFYYLVTLSISRDDYCVLNHPALNNFIVRLKEFTQQRSAITIIAEACLLWITSLRNAHQFDKFKVCNYLSQDEKNEYYNHIYHLAGDIADPQAQTIMGIIHCFSLMDQTDQARERFNQARKRPYYLSFAQLPLDVKAEVSGWLEKAVAQDYLYAHTIMFIYRYFEENYVGAKIPNELWVFSNRAMKHGDPYIYFVLGELEYYTWNCKQGGKPKDQVDAPDHAWSAIRYFEQLLGLEESVNDCKIATPKVRVIEHPNAQFTLANIALDRYVYQHKGRRSYEQGLEDAFFLLSKAVKNGHVEAIAEIVRFIFIKQACSTRSKILPLTYRQENYYVQPPLFDTFEKIIFCLYRDRQLSGRNLGSEVHTPSRLAMLPYDILRVIFSQIYPDTREMQQDYKRLIQQFFTVHGSNAHVTARTVSDASKLSEFIPEVIQLQTQDKSQPNSSSPPQVGNYPFLFRLRYSPPAAENNSAKEATAAQTLPVIEVPKPF
jgi:TPR repeat protein